MGCCDLLVVQLSNMPPGIWRHLVVKVRTASFTSLEKRGSLSELEWFVCP